MKYQDEQSIERARLRARKAMISSIFAIVLLMLELTVSFAWFTLRDETGSQLGNISIKDTITLSYSDGAYYKFKSLPFSLTSQQAYIDSYDYVITENNNHNNLFIVFEIELMKQDALDYTFSAIANRNDVLSKQYYECSEANTMMNIRGKPEYNIDGIGYLVYYYEEATNDYVLCTDYTYVTHQNNKYYYDNKPCLYSTYFLSDCLTVEFCVLNINSFTDLVNKSTTGNLTAFNDFYNSLTDYFTVNNVRNATFIDTTNWTKQSTLAFSGTFTSNMIKTINERKFVYLAVNLKYSEAIMNNTDSRYQFTQNINQLFLSDIRYELS